METLPEIRARLEAAHPVITMGKASGPVPMSEADRAKTLDEWAQAEFDRQTAEQLPAARAQMAAILDSLPLATQASLWATRVAVEQALDRGRLDIARQIVADTPVAAELDATKAQILELFPNP